MTRPRAEDGFSLIELLVVVVVMGVVAAAVTGVIMTAMRSEQFQSEMQRVMDDGRLSIERIRKELRGARRVYESSTGDRLHFWVDQNQDADPTSEEQVCYVVENVPGGDPGQYQLVRWNHAVSAADCAPGATPAAASRQVIARTLTDPAPFKEYTPAPSANVNDPPTRTVRIVLELEIVSPRGPDAIVVEGTVRLRNVA